MIRRLLLLLLLISFLAYGQSDELLQKLRAIPDIVGVTLIKTDSMFKAGYEIRIRQLLDHSKGVSKGGHTTLLYRYYFPNDVDVSVPYVAPVNLAQEDPRIFTWLRSVGDPEWREKIKKYQFALLQRKTEILPLLDKLAQQKGYQFAIGKALVYEYAVLEYPFTFWQYGGAKYSDIPSPQAPADSLLMHLEKVVGFSMYSDQSVTFYHPFFYQAYTEIGYYGYDITEFRGLLTAVKDPTNIILAPKVHYVYNPSTMQNVYSWLRDYGNNIIYIYGGNDTWSATAMELSGKTNAIKIVKPGGFHGTTIGSLPPEQKELVLTTLEHWLNLKIDR
ncbi:MAG: hypothetical protein V1799_20890 [bacterium]